MSASAQAPPGSLVRAEVTAVSDSGARRRPDRLAAEEPLEIRVVAEEDGGRRRHSLAVTMRTPGHDLELAAGFLLSEGIVPGPEGIARIAHCPDLEAEEAGNVVEVFLTPGLHFDPERFRRNVYTTSSCGVCGKASLELLRAVRPRPVESSLRVAPRVLRSLPARLGRAQAVFAHTGGLHGAALFDPGGELLLLREDVGRHNALDKVVGARLLAGELPAAETVALVSGRAGFELVHKAVAAGVPVLAAVGAPSSLAARAAAAFGLTLIGFLSAKGFNVYCGGERVLPPGE